ncbi:hypothetical protein [Rothia uropygialis]|nr:hypothetical protein [Kocuria sp. 36]
MRSRLSASRTLEVPGGEHLVLDPLTWMALSRMRWIRSQAAAARLRS